MRRATKLKRQTIENWLKTQDTYTLHKPIRRKFQRRRVIVGGKNHQFQADLIDLRALRNKNDGVSYLLTCIDVFTKYAYVIPLKRKTGRSLVKAFETIFKTGEVPLRLQTDKGTEFRNRLFQTFLKKHNVHFFVSQNDDIKAAIVERFNRTLKERMWRYFTKHNTKRYVDILPNLVKSYNKTYHRSIKLAPAQVTSANQEVVWQNLYGQQPSSKSSPLLSEGDRVRISKAKKQFEKGYLPSWTEELFTISEIRHRTAPTTYILKDDSGAILEGSFYLEELQKVADKEVYRISNILKERVRGRQKQYLVEWLGYPSSFNSWIPANHIQNYD